MLRVSKVVWSSRIYILLVRLWRTDYCSLFYNLMIYIYIYILRKYKRSWCLIVNKFSMILVILSYFVLVKYTYWGTACIFCSSQQFFERSKILGSFTHFFHQFLVKSGQTCNPLLSVNDLLEVLLLLCMPRSSKGQDVVIRDAVAWAIIFYYYKS